MKNKFRELFGSEKIALFLVFVFVLLNWLAEINIEKLTHPDYYQYFAASEKFFSGNLKLEFIPPLFPFLLGLFGRILSLFIKEIDCFILGGRIISLLAGCGVVFFSYRLLKRFVHGYALPGALILVTSPYYLKLLSIPQTDMLYLFFTAAAFYFLAEDKFRLHSIWAIFAALLTRFEGLLLVGSAYIDYFKAKGKRWLYFTISLIPLAAVLYFLFLKLAPRLIEKLKYIISSGSYLYYFKHPQELVHLFYGNFLYFVSPGCPRVLKWFFFYVLLAAFIAGIYYLFKIKPRFALALLFYELVFIIIKGYTASLNPEVEFRRMFSVIWIFLIAAFIGVYFFFKEISKYKTFSIICRGVLACFLVISALFLPVIKGTHLLFFPVLFFPIIYCVKSFRLKLNKIELLVLFLVLLVSFGQFYHDAGKRAARYVKHNANEGGFVIGRWLKSGDVSGNVLVYSYLPMVQYYMGKSAKVEIKHFIFLDEAIYKNKDKLMSALLKEAKRAGVKYIAFDGYINPEEGYFRVAIYNMLYREKEALHRRVPGSENSYFKLIKTFTYKGEPAAWVLKPLYYRVPGN